MKQLDEHNILFRNNNARVTLVLFFALFVTFNVVQAADGTSRDAARLWSIGLAVASSWFLYRAARSHTLVADKTEISVRTLLREHRVSWHDISHFEAGTRRVGVWRRACLSAVLRDGSRLDFGQEINSSPSSSGQHSGVEELVDKLNALAKTCRQD